MKVKITHTLDLNKVPEKVSELIAPTKEQLEKCIEHLSSTCFLLSDGEDAELVSVARMHIDILRKKLGAVDLVLEEAQAMIVGVDEYNSQLMAKEMMEDALERQEAEIKQKEAELNSMQEVADTETRRVWNPQTRQSEPAGGDGDAV